MSDLWQMHIRRIDCLVHGVPSGVARVDDYKNHDVRMVPGEAERIVAAAAAALAVPLQQRNLDSPVVLNEAVRRCSYQHVMGNLQDDCAVLARSGRT
jgi:hypothetical protein